MSNSLVLMRPCSLDGFQRPPYARWLELTQNLFRNTRIDTNRAKRDSTRAAVIDHAALAVVSRNAVFGGLRQNL
jgi:hypothetical protein